MPKPCRPLIAYPDNIPATLANETLPRACINGSILHTLRRRTAPILPALGSSRPHPPTPVSFQKYRRREDGNMPRAPRKKQPFSFTVRDANSAAQGGERRGRARLGQDAASVKRMDGSDKVDAPKRPSCTRTNREGIEQRGHIVINVRSGTRYSVLPTRGGFIETSIGEAIRGKRGGSLGDVWGARGWIL